MPDILKYFSDTNRRLAKEILEEQAAESKDSPLIGSGSATLGAQVTTPTKTGQGGLWRGTSAKMSNGTPPNRVIGTVHVGVGKALDPNVEDQAQMDRVDKLPADFPFDEYDEMTTKEQLKALQNSGLSLSDQWPLLNSAISLQALSLMNAALKGQESGTLSAQAATDLFNRAYQYELDKQELNRTDASILTPLQKGVQRGELKKTLVDLKARAGLLGSEVPETTPHPVSTPLPQPGPSPEIDSRKAELLNKLKQKVNQDLGILERVKGYNTTRSALEVVFDYDETIDQMSSRYQVPKSVLQTIMFREQRFIDFRDTAADFLVGLGLRKQSSTGPMQVTTNTAIDAINYAVSEGYTTFNELGISASTPLLKDNKTDRTEIWSMLRGDPEFNIEVATQIVRMNADTEVNKANIEDYTEEDLVKLIALYNGRGDEAREYGEECYDWYLAFRQYN